MPDEHIRANTAVVVSWLTDVFIYEGFLYLDHREIGHPIHIWPHAGMKSRETGALGYELTTR